jgi:dihydrodipicolinate synthase/N-acetylneuraminate lyase
MNAYTPNAVRYSKQAEELGADGLMIIPPYYYTPTDDEIFNYYKAICEGCGLPIMLYNNPFTSNVDMSAKLVGRLTKSFEQIRYIKEASQRIERIHDIIVESDGLMNVWAGQRVLESYKMGAKGYVNPYGNYIPRASVKFVEWAEQGRWDDVLGGAKSVIIQVRRDHHRGHPLYGHQCYSKALAAAAGYPVGDVRAPITTFESLGAEGRERVADGAADGRARPHRRCHRKPQAGRRIARKARSPDIGRAVHVDGRAGQVAGAALGQEHRRLGDVFRRHPFAHRQGGGDGLFAADLGGGVHRHLRAHHARRDDIGKNALSGIIARHRLGRRRDRRLGGRIGDRARIRCAAGRHPAADADDRARLPGIQPASHRMTQEPGRRVHIDRHGLGPDRIPFLDRIGDAAGLAHDAGIVDEHVDPPAG